WRTSRRKWREKNPAKGMVEWRQTVGDQGRKGKSLGVLATGGFKPSATSPRIEITKFFCSLGQPESSSYRREEMVTRDRRACAPCSSAADSLPCAEPLELVSSIRMLKRRVPDP